jgi:hypothetical protein
LAYASLKLWRVLDKEATRWQVAIHTMYPRVDRAAFVQYLRESSGEHESEAKHDWASRIEGMVEPDTSLSRVIPYAVTHITRACSEQGEDHVAATLRTAYMAAQCCCDLSEGTFVFRTGCMEVSPGWMFSPSLVLDDLSCWSWVLLYPSDANDRERWRHGSRNKIALVSLLEVARAAAPLSKELSLVALECYTRAFQMHHGYASGWSLHEMIAVMSSRIHLPERAIWHCERLLNQETFPRQSVDFQQTIQTAKILVSQYCVVSEFEKAKTMLLQCLEWAKPHLPAANCMPGGGMHDMDSSQLSYYTDVSDDAKVSLARVHLLDGCPDACAQIINEFLLSSDAKNPDSKEHSVEIRESALALLARAFLDMDDIVSATRIIMSIKKARTERKARSTLVRILFYCSSFLLLLFHPSLTACLHSLIRHGV